MCRSHVGLLKGEHDDRLGWPLELDVAIELLNWREDKGHHEQTVTMIQWILSYATKNGIKMSPWSNAIHPSLATYPIINSANTEYLRNNSLRLRVNTATIHSRKTSCVTCSYFAESQQCLPVSVWMHHWLNSQNASYPTTNSTVLLFYTHQHGYKMCLMDTLPTVVSECQKIHTCSVSLSNFWQGIMMNSCSGRLLEI